MIIRIPQLYLDCCCLGRPFDDLTQPRVRSEAAAVEQILQLAHSRQLVLVTSEALRIEISRNPNPVNRFLVSSSLSVAIVDVPLSDEVLAVAARLEGAGARGFDGLHLASAQVGCADYFVTTDDRLLRFARTHANLLPLQAESPGSFLELHRKETEP